jgi:tetratricopeptide (TPR) repeat protein
VISTVGHPSWTAELVAVTMPFCLEAAARVTSGIGGRDRGLIPGGTWLLGLSAVVATGSRLGLAALLVGSSAWWVLRSRGAHPGTPRVALPVLAVLAAAVAAAGLPTPLKERLSSADPVRGRVALAAAAGELVRSSPVVGRGAGHVQVALSDGLRLARARAWLPDGWMPRELVDRIDNDLLQAAVEGGLPAALLLLATWVTAVRRSAGRGGEGSAQPAAFGALLGFGVAALGSAPLRTPATAVVIWTVVGLVAGRSRGGGRAAGGRPAGRRPRRALRWMAAGLAALLAAAAVDHAVAVVQGNRLAMAARSSERGGDTTLAMEAYRRALELAPWDHESRTALAGLVVARGGYEEGLELVRRARRWSASQEAWLLESRALAATGRLDEGIEVLDAAVAAVPEGMALQIQRGDLLLAAGRSSEAARAFRLALASHQDTPSSMAQRELARRRLEDLSGRS